MNEETLQSFANLLSEYKVFIIIVIFLIITSLLVVKKWLSSNKMPNLFRSAFGIGRDYKSELQAIADQHIQYTKGLTWVYGDINLSEWKQGLTSLQKNIHKSYIVAFGNAKMVIIPVLVKQDKIVGYEPLLISKDNIAKLNYSNLLKTTKLRIADNPKEIEFQVRGNVFKSVVFTDVFAEYDESSGEIIQPDNRMLSGNEIVSKVTINQKQEQKMYEQFIKTLIREIG